MEQEGLKLSAVLQSFNLVDEDFDNVTGTGGGVISNRRWSYSKPYRIRYRLGRRYRWRKSVFCYQGWSRSWWDRFCYRAYRRRYRGVGGR